MSIAQLVDEMRQDPEFAPVFPGTGSSGGGATKSSGGATGGSRVIAANDNSAFLANLDAIASGSVTVGA